MIRLICSAWTVDTEGRCRHCCREGGHKGFHESMAYPYEMTWIESETDPSYPNKIKALSMENSRHDGAPRTTQVRSGI